MTSRSLGSALAIAAFTFLTIHAPAAQTATTAQASTPQQPTPQGGDPTWIDDAEFLKGVARLGQPNVTMPILVKSVEPKYTSDAMRAKVMGTVTVDMVVGIDGSVMRSRISRSLDKTLGLDGEALAAARQWQFKAGLVNGKPAPVLVTATLEFRLH